MDQPYLKILTWNVEWRRHKSKAADELRHRIFECDPDIICLTEAYSDFLSGGNIIEAEADYGYPIREGRRKVLLWSKEPWTNIDFLGHPDLPKGRFVAGQTQTPIGVINVIGVCIPWSSAHVSSGRRDRVRWEDHVQYLRGLGEVIPDDPTRLIVLGDFNQKVPRTTAPIYAFDALEQAVLTRMALPTEGLIEPLSVTLIDHIAHSLELATSQVKAISNLQEDAPRLTDHVGVIASILPEKTK